MNASAIRGIPCELSFRAGGSYQHPFSEVEFSAVFTQPDGGKKTVPGFWDGGDCWKLRYSGAEGVHAYTTVSNDAGLNGISGQVEVTPYEGANPLYRHGAVCRKDGALHLSYADGTPFFWLADTWWMGLTTRLRYPEDFAALTEDRVRKGFNVVQIVAGLYPDMLPFDERGANEAGFPWDREFTTVNPAYFDMADRRIRHLCEAGIAPCIVGSWGFFMKFAGKELLKKHWKNLIARWGAYPVIWCVAGEANMTFYDDAEIPYEEHLRQSRRDWNDMTLFIRENDPFGRLITIHPTQNGHEQIEDETLLDLDMLQTGHGGATSLVPQMKQIHAAVERKKLPVINSECCYEGICGSSYADVQRYVFLSDFFLGAAGHTYGANGIWQVNGLDKPYGVSPHGAAWGDTSWKEAAALPGSGQIGMCARWLTSFDWSNAGRHPEWVENPCTYDELKGQFCIGVPRSFRLFFKPNFGGNFWGSIRVFGLEPDVRYRACRFNPITGVETDLGEVVPEADGSWQFPRIDAFQDWLYALRAVQ